MFRIVVYFQLILNKKVAKKNMYIVIFGQNLTLPMYSFQNSLSENVYFYVL